MKIFLQFRVFLILFLPFLNACNYIFEDNQLKQNIVALTEWKYCEVLNSDTSYSLQEEALKISKEGNWTDFKVPIKLPDKNNRKFIWIKTKLPRWQGENSSLYLGQVSYSMKAFIKDKMIYQWGGFSSATNKYIRWHQNLITLPHFEYGTEILFKIRLGKEFNGIWGKVLFGPSTEIIKGMVRENISNIIFTLLFYLTGLISLIFYFNLKRNKLLLGITLFLIPLGTFIFANTQTAHLIFNTPALFYHLNYLSVISISVGVYFSIEQVVIHKYKPIVNVLWKLPIMFLMILIIIDNLTNLIFYDLLKFRVALTLLSMIISLFALFKSRKEKNYEKRIFIFGISAYFISVIIEVIVLQNIGLQGEFGYHVRAMQYGAFVFVAVVIWIAVHNYVDSQKQKEKLHILELEKIRRENEERHYFSSRLIELQEAERSRIALELHDSIGQKLILIKNQLLSKIKNSTDNQLTKSLDTISRLTGETINEVRSITHNLRPQFLDQLGLKAAIEFMIEQITETSKVTFNTYIDDIDELVIGKDKINFFRIVQESLNNIEKHSQATEAFIKIINDNRFINLIIKDNGIGLTKNIDSINSGIGLTGMKERAKKINADLKFISSPLSGTTIKMQYKITNGEDTSEHSK